MSVKSLIDPAQAVSVPPEPSPAKGEATEVKKPLWKFIKNLHPSEVILFEDGTTFQFPLARTTFWTRDEELAKKIIAVKNRHNIRLKGDPYGRQ